MTKPAKRGAAYDDVLSAPPERVAEMIGGDLFLSPRPAPRHANATSVLGAVLNGAFHQGKSGPGGWWILDEPELHLGGDVMVPDLAGWMRESLPELPRIAWFEFRPDWVCEVISPSTADFDREEKLPRYAKAGVGHLWLVDPQARTLEVFRRKGPDWERVGAWSGVASVAAPPFDAVVVDLSSLWA